MVVINSLTNKKIKQYTKLLQKKYRDLTGFFLVEGEHLVLEAAQVGCLKEVIMCEDYKYHFDVPTTYVTYDIIKKLSHTLTPQKVIGVCQKLVPQKLGSKVLILDDIQDPGNLGTIIRSSCAFNIDTIILSTKSVDQYNDKVIRASEGMIFKINIIRDDLLAVIKSLKENKYLIYGTKVVGGTPLNEVTPPSQYALIMGNEGSGVSNEVLKLCDEYLYIPMNKQCESLNVAIATSIILYSLNK